MRTVKITKPNNMVVEHMDVPEPAENEVLIKVMACGICGTDIHIFRGEYHGGFPVVPGHEFSGVVVKTGKKITKFQEGDRVAVEPNISCDNCYNCLNKRQNFCINWDGIGLTKPGGMAQYSLAPEKNVFNIGSIPFEEGAFVEPLSCVFYGIERTEFQIADKVLIIGAGPIGLLLLKVINNLGAVEVTVVDKNKTRAEYALESGASKILFDADTLQKDFFDVVVDATGVIPVMRKTLDYVRYGGTILLFGVPPSGKIMEIEPFVIFHKGLKILSSYTSLRNSYQAVSLLRSGKIRVGDLVSHKLPLEEFQKGVEMIENRVNNVRKVMILPNG